MSGEVGWSGDIHMLQMSYSLRFSTRNRTRDCGGETLRVSQPVWTIRGWPEAADIKPVAAITLSASVKIQEHLMGNLGG